MPKNSRPGRLKTALLEQPKLFDDRRFDTGIRNHPAMRRLIFELSLRSEEEVGQRIKAWEGDIERAIDKNKKRRPRRIK